MKIYFDSDMDSTVIEGSKFVWPPKTLQTLRNGDMIEVWLKGENRRLVGPIHYEQIQNQAGDPFGSAAEVVTYLQGEFNHGVTNVEISGNSGNSLQLESDGLYSPETDDFDPGDLAALFLAL